MIRPLYRLALPFLALGVSTGCISLKPPPQAPGPEALALEGVPATEFGVETCGAASLSAILAYWDIDISIEELDNTLPKASNGGVVSLDLLLAARERGFQAELVVGDREQIVENLEAGRPLILMLRILNAIGERRDLYHYVIVDGFDPGTDLVRVQYGDGASRWVSLSRLSRSWDDTGFATLVIQPGGAPGEALDSIRYAVALEENGHLEEAAAVYRRLLATAPESALVWVNLGNAEGARGFEQEAEAAYRNALELDPDQPDALNNLAWLLLESQGDLTEAHELASRAVSLGGPDPYLALDSLGRIHLAMGQCSKATGVFRSALEVTPADSTVRSWVLYGLALSQRDCSQTAAAVQTLQTALLDCSDTELCETLRAELKALVAP